MATAKQIAARKKFAEMARSGAFKRKTGASKKRAPKAKASRAKKPPSSAQLAARAKFVAMVRARAKGKAAPKANKKRSKKRNPGVIRFTESELSKFGGKIKGLGGGSAPTRRSSTKRRGGSKFKKAGLFGGSGFLGLGRSTKRIRANKANPKGQHLPGLPAKYQRMYSDILKSSGSKRIAAATTRKAFAKVNPKKRAKYACETCLGSGSRKTTFASYQCGHCGGTGRQSKKPWVWPGNKKSKSRKRNPAPAEVFKEFRGKDVRSRTKSTGHGAGHITVAQLGQLRELKLGGKKLQFGGNALLCADGRKKLHIAGVRFKATGHEEDMGDVKSVTYRSDKPHIESGVLDYVHKFEGTPPKLIVDPEGYPFFEGGSYFITEDGIEG